EGSGVPLAVQHGTAIAFAPRHDARLRAHACAFGETRESAIAALAPHDNGQWLAYVNGVVWALRRAGFPIGGFDLAIASDLPIGAGLSSSAALEMAVPRGG